MDKTVNCKWNTDGDLAVIYKIEKERRMIMEVFNKAKEITGENKLDYSIEEFIDCLQVAQPEQMEIPIIM